jgi:transposase
VAFFELRSYIYRISAFARAWANPDVLAPGWIYNNRHVVERLWARLKEWRAVATRYEKTTRSFLGILRLAATLDWIKR